MKRKLFFFFLIFLFATSSAWAITIDNPNDFFNTGIGNYAAVAGVGNLPSAPGLVEEILGGPSGLGGGLQTNVSESASNTIAMGTLWTLLNDAGITSASSLVFGFGENEAGNPKVLTITDLDMSFEKQDASLVQFSLQTDSITVEDFGSAGASDAEIGIQVDLGFDFMTEYSASSNEDFIISSTITDTSDGFEIYFLSSAYTAAPPIPEPSTIVISGLFLFGAGFYVRRKLHRNT